MGFLARLFQKRETIYPDHIENAGEFRERVLESELPVILDVWGPGCPPCSRLMPVLVKIATRYQGRIRVAEISTSADRRLLGSLGVRSTPTIILYEHGEEVGRFVGFRPPNWFAEMIEAEFPEDDSEE